MAGKALKKRLFAEIEARGGADWLREFVAEGGTVKALADEMGCSRTYLSRHLNAHEGYAAALNEARVEFADRLAEETLEIADGMLDRQITREEIQIAKERIDVRKWLASVNSSRYQPNKSGSTSVTLNIGTLHLDALRKSRVIDVTPEPKLISDE